MVELVSEHENTPTATPVTGVAVDYPSGHMIPAHSHQRSQLVYAVEGGSLLKRMLAVGLSLRAGACG